MSSPRHAATPPAGASATAASDGAVRTTEVRYDDRTGVPLDPSTDISDPATLGAGHGHVASAPAAAAHGGEWANPAPAGLVALAIACFCFFALLLGKVQPSATPMLACWLLGGFVVQFVVGLIELKERAVTGGNVFLFFSAYFMLAGGLKYLLRAYLPEVHTAKGPMEIDHSMDGWAWLVLAIILLLWTPAYLKRSGAMLTMVILALDVAVPIIALRDIGILSPGTWNPIAGWALLASGIFGIYVATAIVLNDAFGRNVIPMPGPFLK